MAGQPNAPHPQHTPHLEIRVLIRPDHHALWAIVIGVGRLKFAEPPVTVALKAGRGGSCHITNPNNAPILREIP